MVHHLQFFEGAGSVDSALRFEAQNACRAAMFVWHASSRAKSHEVTAPPHVRCLAHPVTRWQRWAPRGAASDRLDQWISSAARSLSTRERQVGPAS